MITRGWRKPRPLFAEGNVGEMNNRREPLYEQAEAACLQERECLRKKYDGAKFSLLVEHIGLCRRLVDIGCGWGQLLAVVQDRVPEVWGVDESPDRVKDITEACSKANVLICRADKLGLPSKYFDVAVTSQMLHEVKLFGEQSELQMVLHEIRRILVDGGRYLLLDHLDAGDGEVTVSVPQERIRQLAQFEDKFKYYRALHNEIGRGVVRMSRRCLQDFMTKVWSLDSPMESIEMNETHNVFTERQVHELVEDAQFTVERWILLSDIREDLERWKGELVAGEGWFRKFLLVATTS